MLFYASFDSIYMDYSRIHLFVCIDGYCVLPLIKYIGPSSQRWWYYTTWHRNKYTRDLVWQSTSIAFMLLLYHLIKETKKLKETKKQETKTGATTI